jgi:hypothetical protein
LKCASLFEMPFGALRRFRLRQARWIRGDQQIGGSPVHLAIARCDGVHYEAGSRRSRRRLDRCCGSRCVLGLGYGCLAALSRRDRWRRLHRRTRRGAAVLKRFLERRAIIGGWLSLKEAAKSQAVVLFLILLAVSF